MPGIFTGSKLGLQDEGFYTLQLNHSRTAAGRVRKRQTLTYDVPTEHLTSATNSENETFVYITADFVAFSAQ